MIVDLSVRVNSYWDRGLLGMALHPNFPSQPYIFVLFVRDSIPLTDGLGIPLWNDTCPDSPGGTLSGCRVGAELARLEFVDNGGTNLAFVSRTTLAQDWCFQFPSHSVGSVTFGDDGACASRARTMERVCDGRGGNVPVCGWLTQSWGRPRYGLRDGWRGRQLQLARLGPVRCVHLRSSSRPKARG